MNFKTFSDGGTMKTKSILMQYLINQCHHPTGIVGNIMINIWNKTFVNMALWGISNINLYGTDVLLEIGCGGGTLINHLAKKNYVNKIYGVDISKSAIKKAMLLNKDFIESNKVSFLKGTADNLPFPKDMFDKIFAVQTHMYWAKIELTIASIFEMLIINGEFNIICEKSKIQYHLTQYSDKKTMIEMLKQCGFDTVYIFETKKWIHYQCLKG